jgi:hypothetical protein
MAEIRHAPFSPAAILNALEVQRAQRPFDQEQIRLSREAIARSRRLLATLPPPPVNNPMSNKSSSCAATGVDCPDR